MLLLLLLLLQVRWYERKQNLPPHIQEQMHDWELCELDSNDVNSVGCIDGKAVVINARSYEEVSAYGCRGS
jgi:hypothetical protein